MFCYLWDHVYFNNDNKKKPLKDNFFFLEEIMAAIDWRKEKTLSQEDLIAPPSISIQSLLLSSKICKSEIFHFELHFYAVEMIRTLKVLPRAVLLKKCIKTP